MTQTREDVVAPLKDQIARLVTLGVPALAGLTETEFRDLARELPDPASAGFPHEPVKPVVAIHPTLIPARALAPLLCLDGKPGFVVEDMTDLEEFATVPGVALPRAPLYLVHGIDRGDDLRDQSPEEALKVLESRGRSPLTLHEGISWLLKQPDAIQPNHCFMTLGTRKPKPRGEFDARTPALWISGGTGRDGREQRGAPKIGWCWWRNRHTWLGFASATTRNSSPQAQTL